MWEAIIGAGSKLLGGLLSSSSQEDIAARNIQNQIMFAQHGLSWRAADATAAQDKYGINRLTMLGAPSASFSNVTGDSGLGDAVGSAGESVGRGIGAATAEPSKADQLNEKLLEAKIANVNADTVRMMKAASDKQTILGTPGIPLPPSDPRGPVINLMQRARDPRTGEIVWIPSEKAASPLQTLAASPTNAALAGRSLSEGLIGLDRPGQAERNAYRDQHIPFEPYYTPF